VALNRRIGPIILAAVDRFESLIDRIENRATERIISKQAVMEVRLVACVALQLIMNVSV
jgi:hypothetical protein